MSHVPTATMARLSAMTVADIDPRELRVVARLAKGLEPAARRRQGDTRPQRSPRGTAHRDLRARSQSQRPPRWLPSPNSSGWMRGFLFISCRQPTWCASAASWRKRRKHPGAKASRSRRGVDACHRGPLAEGGAAEHNDPEGQRVRLLHSGRHKISISADWFRQASWLPRSLPASHKTSRKG